MSRFYQVALGAGVSLALGVGTASGALLSHEDFDYPDGGLSGKNNYAPGEWSSAWGSADPQPFSVASGSLMDPSGLLPTSGGHSYSDLWASDLTKPVGMNRNLSSTTVAALNGAQTGAGPDAWVSFLARRDELTTSNHEGGIGFGNGMQYQPGFTIGANLDANGEGTWQVFQGNTPWVDSGAAVTVGETALIVVKMDFQSNNNVLGTIWVNPTPGAAPDAAGVTSNFVKPFAANGSFGISGREYSFDEIRIGESYADVTGYVPEPTSLAVAGLGLAMLGVRRRRGA